MTKRKVYSLSEAIAELGKCARKGRKRSYMWIQTSRGLVKALNPRLSDNSWPAEIACEMKVYVEPRYQARLIAP